MNCPNCQNLIQEGEKFCGKCGQEYLNEGDNSGIIDLISTKIIGLALLIFSLILVLSPEKYPILGDIDTIGESGEKLLSSKRSRLETLRLYGVFAIASFATGLCFLITACFFVWDYFYYALPLFISGVIFACLGVRYFIVAKNKGYFGKGIFFKMLKAVFFGNGTSTDILINILGFPFIGWIVFILPIQIARGESLVWGGIYFFLQFMGCFNLLVYYIWKSLWRPGVVVD
jgi:hypothetical protein